jgi:hypothetical protein
MFAKGGVAPRSATVFAGLQHVATRSTTTNHGDRPKRTTILVTHRLADILYRAKLPCQNS